VTDERVVSPEELEAERVSDTALRPRRLDDFIGQAAIKDQVRILVEAARQRGDARHGGGTGDEAGAIDHVCDSPAYLSRLR